MKCLPVGIHNWSHISHSIQNMQSLPTREIITLPQNCTLFRTFPKTNSFILHSHFLLPSFLQKIASSHIQQKIRLSCFLLHRYRTSLSVLTEGKHSQTRHEVIPKAENTHREILLNRHGKCRTKLPHIER